MVLVHGGGGTAEAEWVRIWNARGYAAISMDTCGCVPGGEPGVRPRHEFGGSPGTGGCLALDVRMPGMELQRQLATQGVTIPIIMITGQRASDHLRKPPPDAS